MNGTRRLRRLALGLSLLAIFPAAWLIQPFATRMDVPICIFRIATSKPCPFCGLTRAFASAMRGRFAQASRFHLLWPAAAGAVVAFGAICLIDAATGQNHLSRVSRSCAIPTWLAIVALVAFTLLRLLLTDPPR